MTHLPLMATPSMMASLPLNVQHGIHVLSYDLSMEWPPFDDVPF